MSENQPEKYLGVGSSVLKKATMDNDFMYVYTKWGKTSTRKEEKKTCIRAFYCPLT